MSAANVATLVGMGATRGQALKALSKYKEVMEAAEAIFADEIGDVDEEEDEDEEDGSEGGGEGDSFYDDISLLSEPDAGADFDPYKGIDMSKERIKTVIELEQVPRKFTVILDGIEYSVEQMTQGQWMQGCPEGSEQSHLFALYQHLAEEKPHCPHCKEPANGSNFGLLLMFESVKDYFAYVKETVQIQCSKCKTQYCTACHSAIDFRANGTPKEHNTKGKKIKVESNMWHCGELQAVLVGVGLAHVQQLMEEPTKQAASSDSTKANKRTKHTLTARPGTAVTDNGTGYAGAAAEDRLWHAEHKKKQSQRDELLRQSLKQVRSFLPNTGRASPVSSDYMPHVVSIAQIRRRLLPIVSRLLQSDSLVDMSERFALYHEVMAEWFRAFASNEALVPLLAQPIFLPTATEYKILQDKSREKHVTYTGSNGPRELAQSIVMQCNDFLVNLDRHNRLMEIEGDKVSVQKDAKDGKDKADSTPELKDQWAEEEQRLSHFAKSFVDDVAAIDRILRKTKGDAFIDNLLGLIKGAKNAQAAQKEDADVPKGSRGKDSAEEIAAYEAWAKTQRYDESDMRQTTSNSNGAAYKHAFDSKIRSTDSSSNHKRGFTIAKELAGLRVSLPSSWDGSIFLRVDESRIDVLKACIVGPEGSPYQNGLFMFDIYFPLSYNHTNPEVKIMTTARGTVRFNPNLYADGKVCLSLLGTWQGPGWISGQSTLLQVLISIQSLVMGVEEPAINEPGWSNHMGKPASIAYSKNCRRQTVAVAMLDHLKEPDAIWKDVIEGHFRLKANAISRQLDKWLQEDDSNPNCGDGTTLMSCNTTTKSTDGSCASQSKLERDVAAVKAALFQQH